MSTKKHEFVAKIRPLLAHPARISLPKLNSRNSFNPVVRLLGRHLVACVLPVAARELKPAFELANLVRQLLWSGATVNSESIGDGPARQSDEADISMPERAGRPDTRSCARCPGAAGLVQGNACGRIQRARGR